MSSVLWQSKCLVWYFKTFFSIHFVWVLDLTVILYLGQGISCLVEVCSWYQLQNRQWAFQGFPFSTFLCFMNIEVLCDLSMGKMEGSNNYNADVGLIVNTINVLSRRRLCKGSPRRLSRWWRMKDYLHHKVVPSSFLRYWFLIHKFGFAGYQDMCGRQWQLLSFG